MDAAGHSLLARVVSFMLMHVCLQHSRVKRHLFASHYTSHTHNIRWLTNEVANGAPITIAALNMTFGKAKLSPTMYSFIPPNRMNGTGLLPL